MKERLEKALLEALSKGDMDLAKTIGEVMLSDETLATFDTIVSAMVEDSDLDYEGSAGRHLAVVRVNSKEFGELHHPLILDMAAILAYLCDEDEEATIDADQMLISVKRMIDPDQDAVELNSLNQSLSMFKRVLPQQYPGAELMIIPVREELYQELLVKFENLMGSLREYIDVTLATANRYSEDTGVQLLGEDDEVSRLQLAQQILMGLNDRPAANAAIANVADGAQEVVVVSDDDFEVEDNSDDEDYYDDEYDDDYDDCDGDDCDEEYYEDAYGNAW